MPRGDDLRQAVRTGARRLADALDALTATEQAKRVRAWHAVDGDRTLRLDYDLGAASVVLDVGGFEGQWASDIFARFAPTIHVFEPVAAQAAAIERRFAPNDRIHVHPVGLAGRDDEVDIVVDGERSSVSARRGLSERVRLVAAAEELDRLGIDEVDLLKCNIEGGEYDLLEHLLDTGLVSRIRELQVQFHDLGPASLARMRAIQRRLAETHELRWQHELVWESWHRRVG
jgi:FkbM family methyltransferase